MVNLDCRMYESKFPEIESLIMVQIKSINPGICAYVSLLEYDNIEGMLSFTELSRLRIRSVAGLVKVGRIEAVMVLNVDEDKSYVNLSKSRVSEEDKAACEQRYNKSKHVHSIFRHVAQAMNIDLEELYIQVGWPLYRKYGHAFEAFRLIVTDPDSEFDSLTHEVKEIDPHGEEVLLKGKSSFPLFHTFLLLRYKMTTYFVCAYMTKLVTANISAEVKDALVKEIRRRMNLQPVKIRAHVELKCFEFDGILHIKDAIRKANASGNADCPVKVRLVGSPLYVFDTQTLDQEQGILILNKAIEACTEEMELHKGNVIVKRPPTPVSERDERLDFD